MLVFAPMPMVRAVSAAKVNPGLLRRVRTAWRRSCQKISNELRSHIPKFLWSFVDSINLMRLSSKKGAHAVLSRANYRKFGASRACPLHPNFAHQGIRSKATTCESLCRRTRVRLHVDFDRHIGSLRIWLELHQIVAR